MKFTKTAEKVKFTKTAKSEVYKNLRKFLEIYKNYKTEVYKNHRKSEVYKNRIFFEIYKFTRVKFTKTTCSPLVGSGRVEATAWKGLRPPLLARLWNMGLDSREDAPKVHRTNGPSSAWVLPCRAAH